MFGVYYQEVELDENFYKILDLGLVGGVFYYINCGFFLGLCLNYGISDIMNVSWDILWQMFNDINEFVIWDDNDWNLNIQVFVGFSL